MYENPDGVLMADYEKRQVPPVVIPTQERHKVYPPPDHDKLEWCREVIDSISTLMEQQKRTLGMFRYDAHLLMLKLRVRLGDPDKNRVYWDVLTFSSVHPATAPPYAGTWKEARAIYREWQDMDDEASPVAARLFSLTFKLARYKAIQDELKSNIEYWEGV